MDCEGVSQAAPRPADHLIPQRHGPVRPAELLRELDDLLRRQSDPVVEVVPGPEESATIRVYWVPAGGGLYGEMRGRMVDGRLAADVFVHPDTEALGLDIARRARLDPLFRDAVVYLTCVHELGHAFGLAHTSAFADIMYSFQYGGDFVAYFMRFREQLEVWDDIEGALPFSAADGNTFRSLYP